MVFAMVNAGRAVPSIELGDFGPGPCNKVKFMTCGQPHRAQREPNEPGRCRRVIYRYRNAM